MCRFSLSKIFLHFRVSETSSSPGGRAGKFLAKAGKASSYSEYCPCQKPVAIMDENGNTVVSYGYDAWGAPLWCTGELAETLSKVQPFRYRGYVFDEETGLYYLRSRYYNVEENRFLSADEGIIVSNKLMTGNMYVYGKNTPICIEDSEGTDAYWLTDIDNVYGFGHTSLLIEDSQTHKWYYFFWGSQSGGIASKAKIQLIEIESVPFDSSGRLDLAAFNIILSTTLVDESTPIENQEYI